MNAYSDCKYTIKVADPGLLKIEVFGKKEGEEKSIGIKEFRVKRIPDPSPRLGKMKGGELTKTRLLQDINNLQALLENFDYDAHCEVVGFEIAILPNRSDAVQAISTSSLIPPAMIDLIHTLPPHSTIFIDDIKVKCPGDANPRNLGSLVFRIVEE